LLSSFVSSPASKRLRAMPVLSRIRATSSASMAARCCRPSTRTNFCSTSARTWRRVSSMSSLCAARSCSAASRRCPLLAGDLQRLAQFRPPFALRVVAEAGLRHPAPRALGGELRVVPEQGAGVVELPLGGGQVRLGYA
jgi:hypothetical protein